MHHVRDFATNVLIENLQVAKNVSQVTIWNFYKVKKFVLYVLTAVWNVKLQINAYNA